MITLAAIGFFLKRVFWFVIDHWKIALILVGLIVAVALFNKACNKPPKLDEKAINRAQQAIAKQDREEMQKILVESDVAEKQISDTSANAHADTVNATVGARQKANAMTNEELAAELERRAHQ